MRKLRSDITHEGLARTPHRAFMRATELDDAAIQKPMIGVVSMKGEQTPCNMTHGFQVKAAKEGVAEAGGTPREFTTISVSDGISMKHEGMKFLAGVARTDRRLRSIVPYPACPELPCRRSVTR
jgi:dihydroxy-acid dehydratase